MALRMPDWRALLSSLPRWTDLRPSLALALRHAVTRAALFLLIALLNPFEIVQWSEQRSHHLWQRFQAPSYEPNPPDKTRPAGTAYGREQITVVHIDEVALESLKLSRPLGAFNILDMLDDVMLAAGDGARPRAVFFDLLLGNAAPKGQQAEALLKWDDAESAACTYRKPAEGMTQSPFRCLLIRVAEITAYEAWRADRHCQSSTLAKIVCIQRARGTPILFADPRQPPARGQTMPPGAASAALDALNHVAATVSVDVDKRSYPLVAPVDFAAREGRRFSLYPAAALYAAYCGTDDRRCKPAPIETDRHNLPVWSRAYENDLDVTWGIGTPSPFTDVLETVEGGTLKQRCGVADPGYWSTFLLFARLMVSGINLPAPPTPCIYTNALSYAHFQTQISQAQLALALKDKLVLIGGQFTDSNDTVPAPPFDALPGVFYHSMALDNLIERGAAYPKTARPVVDWLDITGTDLFNLMAILLVAFVLALGKERLALGQGQPAGPARTYLVYWAKRLGIVASFLLVVSLILYIMTGATVLIPESFNLVAVTLVCLLGFLELVGAALAPLLDSLGRRFAFFRILRG